MKQNIVKVLKIIGRAVIKILKLFCGKEKK